MMNEPTKPIPIATSVWLPFACPRCQSLFRSRSNRSGTASCPTCRAELIITPPADIAEYRELPSPTVAPVVKRRRSGESAAWNKPQQDRPSQQKKKRILMTVCGGLVALIALAVVAILLFIETNDTPITSAKTDQPPPLIQVNLDQLETAYEAALLFLNAPTLDELATFVREPETTMPLIREFYAEQPYVPYGGKEIHRAAPTETDSNFVSFSVLLNDYSVRPIAVEMTDDGPKIDWPSWIGYCEIPWEEFLEKKITTPTLVRVNATKVSYYNFAFSSDEEWVSFRLWHPSSDETTYGYAKTDAPFLFDLPRDQNSLNPMIIKASFPENATRNDQVIIHDLITRGWVLGIDR